MTYHVYKDACAWHSAVDRRVGIGNDEGSGYYNTFAVFHVFQCFSNKKVL